MKLSILFFGFLIAVCLHASDNKIGGHSAIDQVARIAAGSTLFTVGAATTGASLYVSLHGIEYIFDGVVDLGNQHKHVTKEAIENLTYDVAYKQAPKIPLTPLRLLRNVTVGSGKIGLGFAVLSLGLLAVKDYTFPLLTKGLFIPFSDYSWLDFKSRSKINIEKLQGYFNKK